MGTVAGTPLLFIAQNVIDYPGQFNATFAFGFLSLTLVTPIYGSIVPRGLAVKATMLCVNRPERTRLSFPSPLLISWTGTACSLSSYRFFLPSKVFPSPDIRTALHGRCYAHGNVVLLCGQLLHSPRIAETTPPRRCPRPFPV